MSNAIPTQTEKCIGAMLSTAIGDALGWPNELRSKNKKKSSSVSEHFTEWTRKSSAPRWHDELILPGEYSDDTQLTLSISRSIISGDWERYFVQNELPFWLNYQRGGGSAVLKAAKSCKKGFLLWQSGNTRDYFNAGGNGAAMRILPHVIANAKNHHVAKLMTDVIKDTLITHGHPRAFLGATCYAYALDYLLRKDSVLKYGELVAAVISGQYDWGADLNPRIFSKWLNVANSQPEYDFAAEWKATRSRMVNQLKFMHESLQQGLFLDDTDVLSKLDCLGSFNGAGDVAALAAIYFASKYANNPSLGITIPACSSGADTDTIASMSGGLLGMLNGIHWIPSSWKGVQDYDYLVQIAFLLLGNDKKPSASKSSISDRENMDKWTLTPIGKMKIISTQNIRNYRDGLTIIQKWRTEFGQTLYTKSFQKDNSQLPRYAQAPLIQTVESKKLSTVPTEQARKLVLDASAISQLLTDSNFNLNITIGKVLKIVNNLIIEQDSSSTIAKKYNVDPSFVDQIRKYILP